MKKRKNGLRDYWRDGRKRLDEMKLNYLLVKRASDLQNKLKIEKERVLGASKLITVNGKRYDMKII